MHRNRPAVTPFVIAGLIAAGCGSDDEAEPRSGGDGSEAGQVKTNESEPKAKPEKGVRATMIECIERPPQCAPGAGAPRGAF